jgi:hypothetical protein
MQRKTKVAKESKDSKETTEVVSTTEKATVQTDNASQESLSVENKIKRAEKLEFELEQELEDLSSMIASTKDKGTM